MISKLKSIGDLDISLSANDLYMQRKENILSINSMISNILNESIDGAMQFVTDSSIDEFPTFLNNMIKSINQRTTILPIQSIQGVVEFTCQMLTKLINTPGTDILGTDEILSSLINVIYINIMNGPDEERVTKNAMLDKLRQLKVQLEYKSNNIQETAFILTESAIADIVSSSDDRQSTKTIFDDFNSIAQDDIIQNISALINILKEVSQSPCDSNLKLMDQFLNFTYSKLIDNVTGMRKFIDVMKSGLDYFSYGDEGYTILESKICLSTQRIEQSLNDCNSIKYNILDELGAEDIYDNFPSDMTIHADSEGLNLNEGAIGDVVDKGVQVAKDVKDKTKELYIRNKAVMKRNYRQIDSAVQRIIDDYRKSRRERIEDNIIRDTFKASNYIKTILRMGTLAIIPNIGPALSLIYLVTKFCLDKNTELKTKKKLLNDLREELLIIQEKIRDADRDGDNKSKYKLMRIENQLKRSINKIQYNLQSY